MHVCWLLIGLAALCGLLPSGTDEGPVLKRTYLGAPLAE
jgi:hypothetical protein